MPKQQQQTLPLKIRFQTVLRPHRSASAKTINTLIYIMAGLWAIVALGFSSVGAWPVTGFLGLDVVLLYFALHWNNRTGRAYECIDLTEDTLTIEKIDPWGHHQSWSFQPYWLRVELAKIQGQTQLALRSHGESLTIGAFLTHDERKNLALTLRHELAVLMGCGPNPVSD
ncbi:MAG: DUF2244 domain-containing protein [Rhodospirillaceae bacterium]|jgi:uncharacterized membrane protein|nr:DUF2244 domain-containing protein [Rhodospirillales bacterium]MBT3904764.1 DUF2244 domain-containing protein [Rhodospirillaceae bacterium]MBT4700986.1 DUF2244 domain-containing protein [Rhodospirillaceae bacterium]MBT5035236.1 DUF2244 domain-containing protein [Rhodospirillaceae bacterium]MBT6221599.1 DUF2244 domain-containing protein [Rhodospirillaceae bacterium]